jgi:hypothetical protein
MARCWAERDGCIGIWMCKCEFVRGKSMLEYYMLWHVYCILKSCMELSYMDPDIWIKNGVRRRKSEAVDCTYTSPRE